MELINDDSRMHQNEMKKEVRRDSHGKDDKKCLCILVCLSVLFNFFCVEIEAYQFTGYVMSNPSNVKYLISTTVGGYSADTVNYIQQWENKCSEIGISVVDSGENIYFYGDLDVQRGAYAVTKISRDNYAVITYYQEITTLNATQRRETIVHEVGHALGLNHCEASKKSVAVMRAEDFNNKPYPLSDDISGIKALY